ncbi:sterol carrier family protein [Corynebacterium renale]|uniref:sterol carrier family protein n=1 Tax=Corynebacterium renale TaxID=1724 RepID=UPI000DBE94EF|nr:sterol carrier family protein [Corynebacterium renale]
MAKNDPALTRAAVVEIADWIRDPESHPQPPRPLLADAVRRTARAVEAEAPGHTVELRVPPFVAVQCIEGPRHTRGTPPNVVEMNPRTWLQIACGIVGFDAAVADGRVDASGSRAGEVARAVPVVKLEP